MSESWNIAVVGATGEVGKSVLALLEEAELPLGQVFALASQGSAEETLMFQGKPILIEDLAEFDFAQVSIAVFALPSDVALQYVPRALEAGCRVIDHSQAFRRHPEARLVVKGLSDDYLAEWAGLYACADASAAIVAPVLAAIDRLSALSRVQLTVFQAVSARGQAGIRELARQTGELLNARGIDAVTFPQQVAFNLLPLLGEADDLGRSLDEAVIAGEIQQLLGRPELPVEVVVVTVPVFFGHGLALYVETDDELGVDAVSTAIAELEGVELQKDAEEQGIATPVTDAAGRDAVYVCRLREAASLPRGLHSWIVADNVRMGAACHSVEIIKKVIKDFNY